jgi:hypothetical protein
VRRERKSEKTSALNMCYVLYIKKLRLSIPFPLKNVRSNAKKPRKEHKNNRWADLNTTGEAVGARLGQDRLPVCQPGRKKVA